MASKQEGEWSAENRKKGEHGTLRPENRPSGLAYKAYDHEILTQRCP